MKPNREQIVKAIAELRKRGLSNGGALGYHAGWCDEVADLLENALALIHELTEENERLRVVADMSDTTLTDALRIVNEFCNMRIKRATADTVRKMQEKAKTDLLKNYGTLPHTNYIFKSIDQTAKELEEEGGV